MICSIIYYSVIDYCLCNCNLVIDDFINGINKIIILKLWK